jgi:hypothetical protein
MTVVRYIEDQLAVIVADVATKLNRNVMYAYGPTTEIDATLQQMTKDLTQSARKYPLVALFTDCTESKGERLEVDGVVKLHLIVASLTNASYTAPERLLLNFKPDIMPVYDQLLKSIASSGYYEEGVWQKIQHEGTRCYLYGKERNAFSDCVDCYEILNLKLTVKKLC